MKLETFPVLNASLNAASAILLLSGYAFVRARKYAAHATMMIAALITSAAFLACYLTYHTIRARQHIVVTPFLPGPVKPVYLTILISHSILAVVIVPMILTTVVFAIRRNWPRHRTLARRTFPLWLYVSVTGVVIYWMLYHVAPALQK